MNAAEPWRSIAVCADDFGMHPDVDGAILDLVQARRVTTVSCLVGGPTWRQSGPRLAHLDRDLVETGLHFDLTLSPLAGGLPCPRRAITCSLREEPGPQPVRAAACASARGHFTSA